MDGTAALIPVSGRWGTGLVHHHMQLPVAPPDWHMVPGQVQGLALELGQAELHMLQTLLHLD